MLLLITLSSVQTLETQIYVCNKWTDEQIQQQNKQYKEKNLKTKGRKKTKFPMSCKYCNVSLKGKLLKQSKDENRFLPLL